jgi:hypothetical protein
MYASQPIISNQTSHRAASVPQLLPDRRNEICSKLLTSGRTALGRPRALALRLSSGMVRCERMAA